LEFGDGNKQQRRGLCLDSRDPFGKEKTIQNLNVVGDSKTIIRIMISGSLPHKINLKIMIDIIHLLVGSMHINYFHVLRINNAEAEKMANKAIGKALGLMGVDGHERIYPLP
jgi:hypothetical protein